MKEDLSVTLIYAWDRLHNALLTMTLSDQPVKERLADAVIYNLSQILSEPDKQEIPDDLRDRFAHLHKMLTERGTYQATILKMDFIQIMSTVEELFNLYHDVTIAFDHTYNHN